jgi:hypothetical protein
MKTSKTLFIVIAVIVALFAITCIAYASPDQAFGMASAGMMPFAGITVYGRRMFDWSKIKDIAPTDQKAAIMARINSFMKELGVATVGKMVGPDPAFQGIAPVPLITTDTIKTGPDRGYELLFDEVDMRQSSSRTFDIMSITGGVTFYQQEEGEEAKLSKLPTGTKAAVRVARFTGGFPMLDDWLRYNEYYKIEELTADTVRRWWNKKATMFYALIAAISSGQNQAFATDDSTTINNACAAILVDLEAAGYPVEEGSQFAIVCNPTLKARIMKALAASFVNPNTNLSQIVHPISAVVSTTKIANTSYYVCLPGLKSKRGEWEDLNTRPPQRNELVLGADHIWTGAYNGAIGEIKQFRRCALS